MWTFSGRLLDTCGTNRALHHGGDGREGLRLRHDERLLRKGHVPLQVALLLMHAPRPHLVLQHAQHAAQLVVRLVEAQQVEALVDRLEGDLRAAVRRDHPLQERPLHQHLQRHYRQLRLTAPPRAHVETARHQHRRIVGQHAVVQRQVARADGLRELLVLDVIAASSPRHGEVEAVQHGLAGQSAEEHVHGNEEEEDHSTSHAPRTRTASCAARWGRRDSALASARPARRGSRPRTGAGARSSSRRCTRTQSAGACEPPGWRAPAAARRRCGRGSFRRCPGRDGCCSGRRGSWRAR